MNCKGGCGFIDGYCVKDKLWSKVKTHFQAVECSRSPIHPIIRMRNLFIKKAMNFSLTKLNMFLRIAIFTTCGWDIEKNVL